jgi:hypothetical protein
MYRSLGRQTHQLPLCGEYPQIHVADIEFLSLRPDLKPFEMKTLLYWMYRR